MLVQMVEFDERSNYSCPQTKKTKMFLMLLIQLALFVFHRILNDVCVRISTQIRQLST